MADIRNMRCNTFQLDCSTDTESMLQFLIQISDIVISKKKDPFNFAFSFQYCVLPLISIGANFS